MDLKNAKTKQILHDKTSICF